MQPNPGLPLATLKKTSIKYVNSSALVATSVHKRGLFVTPKSAFRCQINNIHIHIYSCKSQMIRTEFVDRTEKQTGT